MHEPESPNTSGPALPAAAVTALSRGHKVEAIRITRQELGIDLKEAKQAVDRYQAAHPRVRATGGGAQEAAGRSLVMGILLLAALGLGLYWVFRG